MGEFSNEIKEKEIKKEGELNIIEADLFRIINIQRVALASIEQKVNNILQFEPEPVGPEMESKEPGSALESLRIRLNQIAETTYRIERLDKHLSNIIS